MITPEMYQNAQDRIKVLTDYIRELERRLEALKAENRALREALRD